MKIRLFIAINLPGQIKKALRQVQSALMAKNKHISAKWVDIGQAHLTLHFLGWVEQGMVNEIVASMDNAAQGIDPFRLCLGQLGCFPNTKQPRVIWIGLEEQGSMLSRLHAQLGREIQKRGFEIETRPFSPHLTLARLRAPAPVEGLDAAVPQLSWKTNSVDLMESKLGPKGPKYATLKSVRLS